jgi:hypothetical protein
MLTYPTRSQAEAARTGHYGTCTTLDCQLRNAGWAQSNFTDSSLRRVGARPPLVWVDVEPRHQQPWSGSLTRNALVIRAAVAGLQAKGYAVGLYSTAALWRQIAGFTSRLPEWVPGSTLTGGCTRSFSAGPVWLSQQTVRIGGSEYDLDATCAGAPAKLRWWQRSHPTVGTARDRASGDSVARYDGGPPVRLLARGGSSVVVAAATTAGTVPLFAVIGTDHRLRLRTLATRWVPVSAAACLSAPALAVTGALATVQCLDSRNRLRAVAVALGADARPGAVSAGATSPALPATASALMR